MTELILCKDLALPLDVVTQTVGILAKRRSGKSYLARRFAEQLHAADQQLVIVDPKGDWWGARSAADGKSPGMPIVILGGDHGDLPLTPESGAVVARLVVEERVSVLLDLSLLRKHEVATFMAVFLEDLYRLKARAEYRTPLMLFVDEADAIAPQKPQPNEMRMLGAMNDVVRRGGQRGLGCCVITQRSAVLSKDVLTQVQVLIALRTMSPQDLAAIKAWIDVHGTLEQQKVLMASLPSLPVGDAWFWSPGWPTDAGIFQRSHVLPISTFDSGATPKAGEAAVVPKHLAEVDLQAVRRQMAETIEKAQQDDPKALRARIKELEASVGVPAVSVNAAAVDELASYTLHLQANRSNALMETVGVVVDVEEMCRKLHTMLDTLKSSVDSDPTSLSIRKLKSDATPVVPVPAPVDTKRTARKQRWLGEAVPKSTEPSPVAIGGLATGEAAVLNAISQKKGGATKPYLTLVTGLAAGSIKSYTQRLVSKGLVARGDSGVLLATAEAFKLLPKRAPLPTGKKLAEHYIATLPGGEAKVFCAVVSLCAGSVHPALQAKLATHTGLAEGSVKSYTQRLVTRGLLERDPHGGGVRLHSEFGL